MASPRLLLPLALGAGLILPATAGAAEFCVATTVPCPVPLHNVASVQAAVDAADVVPGEDRVRVGPGVHTGDVAIADGAPLTIAGEGREATILAGTGLQTLAGVGANVTVRDLTVRPAAAEGAIAVNLAGGRLEHVGVEGLPGLAATGVRAAGGVVEDAEIVVPAGRAVDGQGGAPVMRRSRIAGRVYAFDESLELQETVLDGRGLAIEGPNGEATLRNVLVVNGLGDGVGLSVRNGAISGHHVTVVDAGGGAVGVDVANGGEVALDSSVVSGFPVSLRRTEADGPVGPTNLTVTGSSYAFGAVEDVEGASGGTLQLGPGNVDAAGGFVGAGDYRLRGDAPQVDAGAATALTATDLGGLPRLADGDGDGAAQTDMGAFEYGRRAPGVTITAPATARAGVPVAFAAAGTDADGEPLTYAWSFGASGAAASAALPAGAQRVTVTATDPAGLTATASAIVQVAPATGPGGGPDADTAAPALTGAKLGKRRFARSRATVGPAAGGALSLTLSEPARVALRVQRKRGGRWVAARGRAALELPAGPSRLRFRGSLGKRLRPGRHRLVIVATDAAGNRSAPARLTFKVRRG